MAPNPAPTWIPSPQPQSPFFRLPRELRDIIYEFALDGNPRAFQCGSIIFRATRDKPTLVVSPRGLETWILTSKGYCTEAMQTFLRTRNFAPAYRVQGQDFSMLNPLVFHDKSIHHVAFEYPKLWKDAASDKFANQLFLMLPEYFLATFDTFFSDEVSLMVDWRARFQDTDPEHYFNWPHAWCGRFWKVQIFAANCSKLDSEQLKFTQAAEEVGARIVVGDRKYGEGAAVVSTWVEEKEVRLRYGQDWKLIKGQCLTVVRKSGVL